MAPQAATADAPSTTRIPALDVLRGVAVGGILLANIFVFFGLMIMPADRMAALPTAGADAVAAYFERIFVEGKFYSIFSLLFGIGFGVQLARGGDAAVKRFRRRLKILLAIGAVHAFLIWSGDILMLYALLGFTMPWFARRSDRDLLRWAIGLLATPTLLYAIALAVWMLAGHTAWSVQAEGVALPPDLLPMFERIGTGAPRDAFVGNLLVLVGRWLDLFATVRFPKVLGMFVLGLWTVRSGVALSPPDHRPLIRRWALRGWMVGLPACAAAALIFGRWAAYLPPSPAGLAGVVMQAVGFPMLGLGYAGTIALLVIDRRRIVNVFAPMGRMALTNYLMQSVIGVTLATAYGFGLWWQVGASRALAIAVAIIAFQIPFSALWLRRFRYGPVEWVWRRLTYGRPI